MYTNFIEKYQALHKKVTAVNKQLEKEAVQYKMEEYQRGQILYRQENYKKEDLKLQNDFNRAQSRLLRAWKSFKRLTKFQKSDPINGCPEEEKERYEQCLKEKKEGYEQYFKNAINIYLSQIAQVVKEWDNAFASNKIKVTSWCKHGIVFAFWQDILAQLKDVKEPGAILKCLDAVQRQMQEVSDIHYIHENAQNRSTDLKNMVNPNKTAKLVNNFIDEKEGAREKLVKFLGRCEEDLFFLSNYANIWTRRINQHIYEYDYSDALSDCYSIIQNEVTELFEQIVQEMPEKANIYLTHSSSVMLPTATGTPPRT